MPKWRVFVRDHLLTRIAEVDDYVDINISLKYNQLSNWSVTLPWDSGSVSLFQFDVSAGVSIYRDDQFVIAGPLRKIDRRKNKNVNTFVASGPDDLTWLFDQLAWPPGPWLTGELHNAAWQEFDTRTGAAETVIKGYIHANIGGGSDPARTAPIAVATDLGRGASVTGQARFDNLLDFVSALALEGGDWRLVFDDNVTLDIAAPRDMTATVVFSEEFGNVSEFNFTLEAPTADYVVAGGSGTGAARIFGSYLDSTASGEYGRIEYFLNENQSGVVADLNAAAQGELLKRGARSDMSCTAVTTPQMQFGRDYMLGDIVSVVMDGVQNQNPIRQIDIVVDKDGEKVKPTIAPPINFKGARERMTMLTELMDVRRRVRKMETA